MKKCILIALALLFIGVAGAIAGEDPYIAVVGQDNLANQFYVSPKYLQFMYNPADLFLPNPPAETFTSNKLQNQPEICDTLGSFVSATNFSDRGNRNAHFSPGNAGTMTWRVFLPKKPSGEINLCVQCGVLKPNTFLPYEYQAVKMCAAETGERIAPGFCTRQFINPGQNPIINSALPMITAIAYPGPQSLGFTPFNLTAYKNPSTYALGFSAVDGAMLNNGNAQILNGSTSTRVLLKSCMDKCLVVKLPVTGQLNALGQVENDLEAGDIVEVKMTIPRTSTVDTYCHAQSLKVMGIGEAP